MIQSSRWLGSHASFFMASKVALCVCTSVLVFACSPYNQESDDSLAKQSHMQTPKNHMSNTPNRNEMRSKQMKHHALGHGKPVIYQVFTRLFGNTMTTNKPWGTIEENGVGKFADFTDEALQGIKALGTSYVWYTGVPHHAVVNDYSAIGIRADDPDVVKGRAGSPYAVKDYYNVNPDLALDPKHRLAEFEALIARTHANDLKVIIDIVPNHVARKYASLSLPEGQTNFGSKDDVTSTYARDNNFYYVTGKTFSVPESTKYKPLGGEVHPLSDGKFDENPAKWTGNGSRLAQPDINDWYETIKVNYGVRPDGSYDFPRLPEEYRTLDTSAHHAFWQNKVLPDSWYKFEAIAHYWLEKGVNGFRFDMAEMVPVEFWSFLNASIKQKFPETLLLAEVYNPSLYRDYIQLGKMDYLYDKVGFYDDLKNVMQGQGDISTVLNSQAAVADISANMLHFLENHDEQRIASPEFTGSAEKGKPAWVVSALISDSPSMLYFGQDVGEDGSEDAGFGKPSRTSIFDYVGVPAHQRWMNGGKFDGGALSYAEKALRQFYIDVTNISARHAAMFGEYTPLHSLNLSVVSAYSERQLAFVRHTDSKALVVMSNFATDTVEFDLRLPIDLIAQWGVSSGNYALKDVISGDVYMLNVAENYNSVTIPVRLDALGSVILELDIAAAVSASNTVNQLISRVVGK